MDLLPHDLLVKIAARVCPSDLKNLRLVNVGFCDAVSEAAILLSPNDSITIEQLEDLVAMFPNATSLDISRDRGEIFSEGCDLHELGGLSQLQHLKMENCIFLTYQPDQVVGHLTNLQSLSLSGGSSMVHLPEGISNLMLLTTLDLSDCSRIRKLPEGLGNLTALKSLNCRGCDELLEVSEEISALTGLQVGFYFFLYNSWG